MAQKVQLATALVNSPKLLLLDEPFSGLDPVNQAVLQDEILAAARTGRNHSLLDARHGACRAALHAAGHAGARPESFRWRSGTGQGDVAGPRPRCAPNPIRRACRGVARAEQLPTTEDGWTDWQIVLRPGSEPGDLLQACIENGFVLRDFEAHSATLHDVFLHLAGPPAGGTAMRRILLVTAREYRRMITLAGILDRFADRAVLRPGSAARADLLRQVEDRRLRAGRQVRPLRSRRSIDASSSTISVRCWSSYWSTPQEWRAGGAIPRARRPQSSGDSSSSDAAVRELRRGGRGAGGAAAVEAQAVATRARRFSRRLARSSKSPLPQGVDTDSAARFGASIGPHFQQSRQDPAGSAALAVAVYIPDNVDSGGQVRVWTNGPAGAALFRM